MYETMSDMKEKRENEQISGKKMLKLKMNKFYGKSCMMIYCIVLQKKTQLEDDEESIK